MLEAWPAKPFHVGISGWRYPPWRGDFYPRGLAQSRELEYASRQVNSIEINGSFYALQRPASYQQWHDQTPSGFVFSVKGPRFITHMKRLADVETPLANFFASGVLVLSGKLGPILWQLPPNFSFDAGRLSAFFELLPRSTTAAASLATGHEPRLDGRAHTTTDEDRPLRHALEVRHPSFVTPSFVDLLRANDIALVCADAASRWPMLDDVTSTFVYLRLHGDKELYTSGYDAPALDRWAARVRRWQSGGTPRDGTTVAKAAAAQPRDVYAYFDNDVKVRAPYDAIGLMERLGVTAPDAAPVAGR